MVHLAAVTQYVLALNVSGAHLAAATQYVLSKMVKGSTRKTVHPERTRDEWHSKCLDFFFQLEISARYCIDQ